MKTFKRIQQLIEQQDLNVAEQQLFSASKEELSPAEHHYLLGLIWAKRADWKQAKSHFLEAVALDPKSPAQAPLEMLTNIYDYYYKDNLNP
jgi:hypothetical protein